MLLAAAVLGTVPAVAAVALLAQRKDRESLEAAPIDRHPKVSDDPRGTREVDPAPVGADLPQPQPQPQPQSESESQPQSQRQPQPQKPRAPTALSMPSSMLAGMAVGARARQPASTGTIDDSGPSSYLEAGSVVAGDIEGSAPTAPSSQPPSLSELLKQRK
ncbi:MAG: hypothetical protein JOZ69_23770 [Myxococcales bacterium]|nr:hypothetical protein [Myxococcales bacterium]